MRPFDLNANNEKDVYKKVHMTCKARLCDKFGYIGCDPTEMCKAERVGSFEAKQNRRRRRQAGIEEEPDYATLEASYAFSSASHTLPLASVMTVILARFL